MLIAAPSGIGKSLLALNVIRALTLGKPVFGWEYFDVPRPCRVLYMDQEVLPKELKGRILSIFEPKELLEIYKEKRFKAISAHPNVSFTSPDNLQHILDNVEKHKPEVVIFDPIGLMHEFEENSNTEIGKLMNQINLIKSVGKAWGLSVIIIHHTGKAPVDKDKYDGLDHRHILGASKFVIPQDSVLMLEKKGFLDAAKESWRIKARFSKVRHSKHFDDFLLHLNEHGNLRANFQKTLGTSDPTPFPKMDGGITKPEVGVFDALPKAGDPPTGSLHTLQR